MKAAEKKIAAKLRGSGGVTIIFALLAFLFLSILCVTMVEGALTAAQNSNDLYLQEQSYLSVSSAASLLDRRITDADVCYVQEISAEVDAYSPPGWELQVFLRGYDLSCDNRVCYKVSGNGEGNEEKSFYPDGADSEEALSRLISEGADPIMLLMYAFSFGGEGSRTLTFCKPENGSDTLAGMKDVSVTMTMDANYNLTVRLVSVADPNEEKAVLSYHMTEYFRCIKQIDDSAQREFYIYNNADDDEDRQLVYTEKAKVTVTTLRWELDRVERGDLDEAETI